MKASFGAAVRAKRAELRISQEELADRAGLHRTYISDIERGARNPSLESIAKLARALELSLSVLFGRTACPDAEGGAVVEILLVEDEPRDVELTMRAFERARLSNPIHVLRDGAAALEFIFATGPHAHRRAAGGPMVVLLDLNLPVIGGLEVLRRMKADKRTREIPVVILTLSNRDRDMAECRRLGAVNYIVKPVGFQNFSEVIPSLEMEWALLKTMAGTAVERTRQ